MKQVTAIFVLCLYVGWPLYAEEIQRLKRELRDAKSDTSKVWMLRDLAYYYQNTDSDSAMYYAQQGYILAETLGFDQGQIWCLYQKGRAYETKNQLDSALAVYEEAVRLAEVADDALSKAKLLNAMGVIQYFAGNFHHAVLYYHRGFQLSDSLAYQEGMSYALNNMAVIYRLQRRYDRALALYSKSLEIKTSEKDTVGIISSLYNKGLAFSYLDQHEKSLVALTNAKQLAEMYTGAVNDIPNITIGIGVAHYNLGDIVKSKEHLEKGIELAPSLTPEKLSAMAYLGSIDVMNGRLRQGMATIEEAYELTISSGRKELLRTILKERATAAERTGNHRLAQESWKSYGIVSDSLNRESHRWAMQEMQARFELLDKENTISLQQLRLEKEANQRKWYLFLGIMLIGGLVTTALFLRKILKQRKQLSTEIIEKEKALDENDLLLQEMHHRTKNNLQLLDSILSLYSRNVNNDAAKMALQSSRDSVGAIGLLHHQLYHTVALRNLPFKPYVRDLCESFQTAYSLESRNITLKFQCDDFQLDIDKAIPLGLVINEMVTNAIKHGFQGRKSGKVNLRVQEEETQLMIEVEDDGVGLADKQDGEGGAGKKLIEIFSHKFKADFYYTDNAGRGTLARFHIPCNILSNT